MLIIKKLTPALFIFIIFVFLLSNIYRNWQLITNFNWQLTVRNFFPIILLLIPLYLINATSWYLLTRSLGFKLSYYKSVKIWLYSNITRFVPGVVWQYIGRVYLINQEGITKERVISALGLEVVFNLITGLFVVLLTFSFWRLPIHLDQIKILLLSSISLVGLVFIFTSKKILIYIINFISKISGKPKITFISLPLKWIPILFFSYFLQFFFAGALLFFWVRIVTTLTFNLLPTFIGIFASAWLIGYIALFSPSGLGVQELLIIGLLSFYIPFSMAGIIAILFRLSMIVSEICTVFIFYLLQKFTNLDIKSMIVFIRKHFYITLW